MIPTFPEGMTPTQLYAALNELAQTLAQQFLFTLDRKSSAGFSIVITGGRLNGTAVADTTLTLATNATSYVEATSAGAVSANTSGFSGGTTIPIGVAVTTADGLQVFTQYFR